MRSALLLPCLALAAGPVLFEDITARSGITFRHQASKTANKYLIESTTGGVAMLDYDNDGWLDLYFVNGAELKPGMKAGEVPAKSDPKYFNRLYRNKRDGTFEDVTEKAGVKGSVYDMGATAADYDNDGDADIYVTGFPRNTLYRNNGDGTFTDATAQAGVAGKGWTSSAAFVDVDHDGRLDLVAVRYVDWDFEPDKWCGARKDGYRSYCHPDQFEPISSLLFHNKGDGTFEDWTERSGFAAAKGKGLGISIEDFNRDGKIDVAVAIDSFPQQLFRNLGEGKFQEMGFEAGVAYDDDGNTYGGMGTDFADYNNDGWPDLLINALASQRYALYRNKRGTFEYYSAQSGISASTRMNSGWGMKFVDYDNDGWKDIIVAQGHVMDNIMLTQPLVPYLEPIKVLRNVKGKFVEVQAFEQPLAARGAAFGDLNNDGWPDIAVACLDNPAVVIHNKVANGNHWIRFELEGTKSNRDGIGARITVVTPDGNEQNVMVSTSSSYLSANDKRAHFGLGAQTKITSVEVLWPSGVKQMVEAGAVDRTVKVKEQ